MNIVPDGMFQPDNSAPASGSTALQLWKSESEQVPIITRYLRIFWRWKHVFIGFLLLAFVGSLVTTLLMTPQYTAETTVEISRETDRVVQIKDVRADSGTADLEFYQTQYGLLRSRSLAERVVREMRLADDPAYFKLFDVRARGPAASGSRFPATSRQERVRQMGEILLKRLSVNPMRLSRLAEIKITTPDASLSTRIVNKWAADFIQSNLERRFQSSAYARGFLEKRLTELRQRLETSERNLVQYASREQIINLPGPQGLGGTSTGERSLVADDLAALNAELTSAKADRIRAQSRLNDDGKGRGAVAESLNNVSIGDIRQKRAEIAAEHARMLSQFEPGYPQVKALRAQLAELDRAIQNEEGRVGASFRTAYRDAAQREETLEARVAALKSNLLTQRQRSIQYNIYQRDIDTSRQLYDALLQRYKEIGVAGGVGTNNVSIVDLAEVPKRPSQPNLFLNLAIGLGLGFALGLAAVFALEQIDETIADPADVERVLNVPLLGTIPRVTSGSPIEMLLDRKSDLVEAYFALHTTLRFATDHGFPRTLSFTSTRPGEGKSTSAYALAVVLARTGHKTLLIDADMRNPSVHKFIALKNDRGFSNLLAGSNNFNDMLRETGEANLTAILAGPAPPNAAELLTSDRLPRLLAELSEIYENIIIDCPPVMGLADSPQIASRVEGTIFVVEAHGIRARLVRVALGRLNNAHAHVIGAVLDKFDSKRAHYGYGYDYGYTYGSRSILKAFWQAKAN